MRGGFVDWNGRVIEMSGNTDIDAILKATIQTKVVEAFNQTPAMIDKLVEAALSKKVGNDGRPPSSGSYTSSRDSMPYMEWLVGEEIRKAVTESMRDYVAENKDQIKTKVDMTIKNADLAKPLGDTLVKILSDDWRWSVNLEIKENS